MSSKGGPSTTTDGLVLSLDAANIKSFPGRPTTNYAPSSFGDWGTEGTSERIATGRTYKGQPTYNCRTQVGAVWIGIYNSISGLRTAAGSGGTVTMSCFIRNNNSSSYNCTAYIGHDFTSTRTIAANSGWQRIQWTVNQSSMNNDYVEFRPYTNNASIYLEMTMPQVEVNIGSATRFGSGTRSTTDAWRDRSGNNNHGDILNGVDTADDDTAQESLDFDGTNDYIDLGTQLNDLTVFTVEGVFKTDLTSSDTFQVLFGAGPLNTSNYTNISIGNLTGSYPDESFHVILKANTLQFYIRNGANFYFDQKYHHFVVNTEANKNAVYIDGVQQSLTYAHGSSTVDWGGINSLGASNQCAIGRRSYNGGDGYFNGKIPFIRVYNRSLTEKEILANYNAIKGRFDL